MLGIALSSRQDWWATPRFNIIDAVMVSAMGPPGGGRAFITERPWDSMEGGSMQGAISLSGKGGGFQEAINALRPEAALQHAGNWAYKLPRRCRGRGLGGGACSPKPKGIAAREADSKRNTKVKRSEKIRAILPGKLKTAAIRAGGPEQQRPRGGIEPLHVPMSLDLKSSPNPSWNHGGPLAWWRLPGISTSGSTANGSKVVHMHDLLYLAVSVLVGFGQLGRQAWSASSSIAGLKLPKKRPLARQNPATGRE